MVLLIAAVAVLLIVLATRRRSGSRGGGSGWGSATLILVVVGLLLVVGLGGLFGAREDSEEPGEPPEVAITAPLDSTEVTSPVSVTVAAERLGGYHLHLTVDGGCVEGARVIPTDATHHHLAAGVTTLSLDLAPGEHTLCLQPGDSAHRARSETDAVTILVGPA
jgi:hypothetical protein